MKTYLVFWTYMANYADRTYRTEADHPFTAIMHTVGTLYMTRKNVRYLVFEVGGDQVFYGTIQEALNELGLPENDDGVFFQRELLKEGYSPVPDVIGKVAQVIHCDVVKASTNCVNCSRASNCKAREAVITDPDIPVLCADCP